MRRMALAAIGGGCLAITGLVPRDIVVVPRWQISVTHLDGSARPGQQVTLWWTHYSLPDPPRFEQRRTDPSGEVHFEARVLRLSRAAELAGALKALKASGIHASFGPSAWAVVGEVDGETEVATVHPNSARKDGSELVTSVALGDRSPTRPGDWPFGPQGDRTER